MAIFVGPTQPPPVGPITPPLCRTPLPLLRIIAVTRLTRWPMSVPEVLGTGLIPSELVAILTEHSRIVRKDGSVRIPEERTSWGLHVFLSHLALGEVPVLGLEKVTLVGVDEDGRVHLMHLLFSVRVNVYSTECCLFAWVGELSAEGLSQVTEIFTDFFAARRAVCAVPRIDHVAHLGGISPRDWQKKACEHAAKAAGDDHLNLACRGLAFLPMDCVA